VVRAYLPDRDAENVKVVVEDGRILKIDAVAEESTDKTKDGLILKRKASYSQRITLPGPVDPDKLAVDRKQDMLVITVPKISHG
jgi:HSP20 family molecular chaperone IbpA